MHSMVVNIRKNAKNNLSRLMAMCESCVTKRGVMGKRQHLSGNRGLIQDCGTCKVVGRVSAA